MTKILFLLLFTSSLFSQKLWEIEVDQSDYLRDVVEIPNSDLLLFTYNTGKLEIRNSQDGSFVKNVTTPQGELGSYNISGLGNSYYFSEKADFEPGNLEKTINDTIFVYDLFSDQIINRISFDIEGFDNKDNIQTKKYKYSFTPDMTKLFGRIEYRYNQPVIEDFKLYYSKYYFYVYDVIQRKVIYHEKCHEEYFDEQGRRYSPGFALDSYRSSPDSKYIILNGRDLGDGYHDESKNAAKMFNIELNEMGILMTNENTSNDKLGALSLSYNFLNENNLATLHGTGFILREFPSLEIIKNMNLVNDFGIYPANNAKYSFCNNIINFITGERIPGGGTQDFRFWLISVNIDNKSIENNYKNLFTTKSMYAIYLIDNCTKIIIGKDIDNRNGIIASYDFNSLDIEIEFENNIFPNPTSDIINIDTETPTNIELFDILGNKILEDYNTKLDISNLSLGTYYIRFSGLTKMVVKI